MDISVPKWTKFVSTDLYRFTFISKSCDHKWVYVLNSNIAFLGHSAHVKGETPKQGPPPYSRC